MVGLQLVPPPQTFRDTRTGQTYTYTGPMQNIMGHNMPMFQMNSKNGAQFWTPTGANTDASSLGANLNQAPRVDFNNLGTKDGPSIADIYGTSGGVRPPVGGAGASYGGFQRPAPRPPGFMPQFNMQQVMQNIAARRAMQPQPQGITALPMGQGLNGAPGPAGIAGLQAIAKGPTP